MHNNIVNFIYTIISEPSVGANAANGTTLITRNFASIFSVFSRLNAPAFISNLAR